MKPEIAREVADKIIAALEKGVAPWVRPWSTETAKAGQRGRWVPHNVVSNREYTGVNSVVLMVEAQAKGYMTGAWATYKQIAARGGQVRKGERGCHVFYLGRITVEDRKDPDKTKQIALFRTYTVFNIDQADWGDRGPFAVRADDPAEKPAPMMASVLDAVRATGVQLEEGGSKACYYPAADKINMPKAKAFTSMAAHHATLLHEMTHWTGHKDRLARDFSPMFGDEQYAVEELVAEFGSAFLCAHFGVDGQTQHAEYIGHWVRVIKDDPMALFKAAAAAQRAADFILGFSEDEADEDEAIEQAA